jgi:hypothetical protein
MTVIGVATPDFRGIDWGEVPSVWVPTMMKREATPDFDWLLDRRGVWLHVFGRLKRGMTAEQAQAALQPWFKAMLAADTRREDWPQGPPEVIAAIGRGETVDPATYYFRTTPRFETAHPPYAFLNRLVAVASGDRRAEGPIYTIHEVL